VKAPPKLVCLESYWNERLFETFSVKGFFEAMAPLVRLPCIPRRAGRCEVDARMASLVTDMLCSATSRARGGWAIR
jgi:hypothetical protein